MAQTRIISVGCYLPFKIGFWLKHLSYYKECYKGQNFIIYEQFPKYVLVCFSYQQEDRCLTLRFY